MIISGRNALERFFFSGGTAKASGGMASQASIKQRIKELLDELSIEYEDLGSQEPESADDYPVFAKRVAERVVDRMNLRGDVRFASAGETPAGAGPAGRRSDPVDADTVYCGGVFPTYAVAGVNRLWRSMTSMTSSKVMRPRSSPRAPTTGSDTRL